MKKRYRLPVVGLLLVIMLVSLCGTGAAQTVRTIQAGQTTARNPKWVPENGFWELIIPLNEKNVTTVRFYTLDSRLMYEETVTGVTFNLNRRKTRKRLCQVLQKCLLAWAQNPVTRRNGDWISGLFGVKTEKGNFALN